MYRYSPSGTVPRSGVAASMQRLTSCSWLTRRIITSVCTLCPSRPMK